MIKRIGRSFISLLIVAVMIISCFSVAVFAAADITNYVLDLSNVTEENGCLLDFRCLADSKSIMAESRLTADPDIADDYGAHAVNGNVKVRFNGLNDSILGITRDVGVYITNESYEFDFVCNYIMEGGVLNHTTSFCLDQEHVHFVTENGKKSLIFSDELFDEAGDIIDDYKEPCRVDPASATVVIPHGKTLFISLTTPKSQQKWMYFTMMNFKAVYAYDDYYVTVSNTGEGIADIYDPEADETTELEPDDESEFSVPYGNVLDLAYDIPPELEKECVGYIDDNNNFIGLGEYYPTGSITLYPLVLGSDEPLFQVENRVYDDFQSAVNAAKSTLSKRVVLIKDGVLPAGDYTISDGVILLIPFDDAHTLYTDSPVTIDNLRATPRFVYKKLTMADGASITVEDGSAISVSAKHPSTTTGSGVNYNGAVAGGYGQIDMLSGSQIILNNGADLYAWGFITGEGLVTAHDGSNVYEFFQINDWRGGTITSTMANPGVFNQFMFNQYYIQNIEAHLHIEYGAVEYVLIELYAGGKSVGFLCSFIDKGTSDECMFRLKSEGSYLEKYYDAANDKMEYIVNGDADIDAITLTMAGVTISSADYYLPISNIHVTLLSNSSLTTDKKIIFLPGSGVTVEEGAEIVLTTGEYTYVDTDGVSHRRDCNGSVVFAAKDDIGKYSANGGTTTYPCKPVLYTPTAHPTRTWADTEEIYLDNNGTIIIEEGGSLAATSANAKIYSSTGNGTFVMNGDNKTAVVLFSYQSKNDNTGEVNSNDVPLVPALVQDDAEDDDISDAHSTAAIWGTPATLKKVNGVWGDFRDATWINPDGSEIQTVEDLSYDEFLNMQQPEAPVKPEDAYGSYEFIDWKVDKDSLTADSVTIYPDYKVIRANVTVTWLDYDGSLFGTTEVEYNTQPRPSVTPKRDATAQYKYTFSGWSSDGGITVFKIANLPNATDDITYVAVYKETVQTYNVGFYLHDPTVNSATATVAPKSLGAKAYGTVVSQPYTPDPYTYLVEQVYPTLTGYVFAGWSDVKTDTTPKYLPGQALPPVSAKVTYYGIFKPVEECFDKHSLTLDGSINVNFFVKLADGSNPADYTVAYTFRGELQPAAALSTCPYDSENGYKLTAYADAPQMTDGVTAILFKNGTVVDTDVYKVADYSTQIHNDPVLSDNEKLKSLVRDMLHYGAMAQDYLSDKGYAGEINIDSAENYIVDPVGRDDVTDQDLADICPDDSTILNSAETNDLLAPYGLKYYGVSAVLDSKTSLRIYFHIEDDTLYNTYKDSVTFGFNDEVSVPQFAASRYVYIEFADIPAAEINDQATLKINGQTVIKYSVADYLRKALASADENNDVKLRALVTAMYWYNVSADLYFSS